MGKVKVEAWKCERCLHIWVGRGKEIPIVCSKCKSPYWQKPRRRK